MNKKLKRIILETKKHIPFTLIATLIAITLIWIFSQNNISVSESFFHLAHPLHLFVSAVVSAAIFYKYKNSFFKALLIGITGAIIIGTLSDVIFPYLGGILFNLETNFHFPLIKNPLLIISTVILGSVVGITTKLTKFPHFVHVFLSVFASLFYLLSFSVISGLADFALTFIIIFIAVLLPCCVSDIVFPLLFTKNENKS